MKTQTTFLLFVFIFICNINIYSQPIIINHQNAFLEPIPEWAIKLASDSLHIAYGHTSHGSQITTGMKALALQSTKLKGYKGDFYCWEDYFEVYGDNPCMDIDDKFVPGDLGHNGDTGWADRTRNYLTSKERAKDINVVMWSWCGGCSDNTDAGIQTYLDAMNKLENDFPNIIFIYMTGHLDHWSDEKLKHNNQLIRDYCIANNKILYDFADIESYDPDGNYYEYSNDNCDYYNENGDNLGNWAQEWQDSHEHGVDWYNCSAAHTKALNGNRKAYAAWWLWARLIGWNPDVNTIEITEQPKDVAFCDEGNAEFNVNYSNADSVRWQKRSPEDTEFVNIYDNSTYDGTSLKNLKINFDSDSLNGHNYRAVIYLNNKIVASDSALLTIDKFIKAKTGDVDETCNETFLLKGSNPLPGTCIWTVVSGGSHIDTATNFNAIASGLSLGENIFLYSITNGLCSDTSELKVNRFGNISITNQPTSVSINTGQDTSFEVGANGDIEFIQWYKGDTVLTNGAKYLGVNTLKLQIRNIEASDKGNYYCEVNGYCNDEKSNTVILDVLTSIQNLVYANLYIYPNPVKNTLNLNSKSHIEQIEIFNINTLKKVVSLNNPGQSIDLSNLINNTYVIKIVTTSNILYRKIVKLE